MATRGYTIENPVRGVYIFTWAGLADPSDDGTPAIVPHHTDKAFSVEGTFGTGGSCALEGTIDTALTNFRLLADPQGTDIDIATADKHVEQVLENVHAYRPRITAGTGVSLTAKLICTSSH